MYVSVLKQPQPEQSRWDFFLHKAPICGSFCITLPHKQ